MKKMFAALIGALVLSTAMASIADPAYALGGCGPNGHRNGFGRCVFGGQNQGSCLRRTGHVAMRMPNGEMVCR